MMYVDVFFTFNIDLELKLTFSQGHKWFFQDYAIGGCHFILGIEPLQLNLDTGRSI